MKSVKLTFLREQLLYDISNIGYVKGDTMADEEQHAKHLVQDIIEEHNIDRVTRMIDLAFAACVEACYPYSKMAMDNEETDDDVLVERDSYVMEMTVPDTFSKTTEDLLLRLIHEFIVLYVLADWLAIVYPEGADYFASKCSSVSAEMHSLLNARIKPVRKRQHPF